MNQTNLTEVEKYYNNVLVKLWDKEGGKYFVDKSGMIRQKRDFIFSHNQLVELLGCLGYKNPKKTARKFEKDIAITYLDEENSEFKNAIKYAVVCKKCDNFPHIVGRTKNLFGSEPEEYQFSCCDCKTRFYESPKEAMEMWNKKNK